MASGASLHFGRIFGIHVRVHWTFGILLAFIAISPFISGRTGAGGESPAARAVGGVLFLLGVFVCVTLHEFGHALAARRFGIKTSEIVLLPIGGVAKLLGMPRNPWQEVVIALAGPAVNVVIAIALTPLVVLLTGIGAVMDFRFTGANFFAALLVANVMLVAFNLIPAFPLDGGRVLRALLSLRLGMVRATDVSALIGRVIAVGFAIVGVMGNPMLVLIAVFVWFAGGQEAAGVRIRAALDSRSVGDVLEPRVVSLALDTPIERALDETGRERGWVFAVVDPADGRMVGVVTTPRLLAEGKGGLQTPVGRACLRLARLPNTAWSLGEVVEQMQAFRVTALPIAGPDGRPAGTVTFESIERSLRSV
jgi:Zn-dependent protease